MTRQEFELFRLAIEAEKYIPEATNPLSVGLERGHFEKRKLERLLAAARTCDAMTVQRKLKTYEREIVRVQKSIERFEKLRNDQRAAPMLLKKLRSSEGVIADRRESERSQSNDGSTGAAVS